MSAKGPFVIVSGPSGVGKTALIEKCLKELPQFSNIISFTTRKPRSGEINGRFYYFVSREKFYKMKEEGELLESENVHGEFYGTSKKEVERVWSLGKAIIKDVDVRGCISLKKVYPDSLSVFIYPPAADRAGQLEQLKKRITGRGKEAADKRLSIAAQEMEQGRDYDFQIINDNFEKAWQEFKTILLQSLEGFAAKPQSEKP